MRGTGALQWPVAVALAAWAVSDSALAVCLVGSGPNVINCAINTTTTDTTNTNGATNLSSDRIQVFNTGGNINATVGAGVTVDGFGLAIDQVQPGSSVTLTNNGSVQTSVGNTPASPPGSVSGSLGIRMNGGDFTYSGSGTIVGHGSSGLSVQTGGSVGGTYNINIGGAISTDNGIAIGVSNTLGKSTTVVTSANVTTGSSVVGAMSFSGGNIDVTANGGTVQGAWGLFSNTAGTIKIAGNDAFVGTVFEGISAFSVGGPGVAGAEVLVTGSVTGVTDGIRISANGGVAKVSGTGAVVATNGDGITAAGTLGAIVSPASSVTASGYGIQAGSEGTVSVTTAGPVTAGGAGIKTFAKTAATTINVNGNVTSSGADGIITDSTTGTVALTQAAATTISGVTSGITIVTQGASTLGLAGNVTATGAGSSAIKGANLAITNSGQITNAVGNALTLTGGTSSVAFTGAGTLSGGISLGNGSALTLDLTAGSNLTLAKPITGDGTLTVAAGTKTLTLSAVNTYTGPTNINSGTLQMGIANALSSLTAMTVAAGATFDLNNFNQTIGSLAGAGNVTLGTATLTAGGNNTSTTYSGVMSGSGGFTKAGTGTMIMSGANTYTGATTLNGGTLSVNGSIGPSSGLTVNSGATVGGIGTLPTTIINAGGTLSPGNSIGTIAISGSLSFVGAGNYVVEVSATDADRTNATGTAALSGTLQAVGTGGAGYAIGKRYTILNATGGVGGTFGTFQFSGNFGATKPHVEYDANNVYLVLDPNAVSPFLVGGTRNQRAVAGAIDASLLAGNSPAPFLALFNLTAAQLPAALDQLSGEVHPTTMGVLVDESQYARSAVLGRLRQASYGGNTQMASLSAGGPQAFAADGSEAIDSALAYAKSPIVTKAPMRAPDASGDVVFWGQGFGAYGRFDSDGNATNVRRDLAGFFSGVDTRVGTNGRLGVAAGYTGSRNQLDGRGSSNVETGHVSGYGGWAFGNFNLRAGGAVAWHTIETSRAIVFPGFFDTATATYNARTGQIFGEAGYGFAFGNVAVEPFAGGAWVRLNSDGFTERAIIAGLSGAAQTFEVGYSHFGIRAASMIPVGNDMVLIPRASLAWQHAFTDVTPEARLAFIAAPTPFVIGGTPIARDAIMSEAGVDLAIGRNATVGVSYTGQVARNVQDHAAKGKFSWKF